MLKSAEFTREVQRRANEEYENYCRIKDSVSQTIMFAACVGSGECDFEIPYSITNRNFIKKVSSELVDLGYMVESFISSTFLRLHISW